MFRSVAVAIAMVGLSLLGQPAAAATTYYFGESTEPGGILSGLPLIAYESFLNEFSTVSTHGFETFAPGSSPAAVTFTGAAGTLAADRVGDGYVTDDTGFGRFPTEGANYLLGAGFGLEFASAVGGFGLFVTDAGDADSQLYITYVRRSGATNTFHVGNTPGHDGSLVFFGAIDLLDPFVAVGVATSGGPETDFFGADQLTVGAISAATPTSPGVPEPATWGMMIMGFAAIGATLRRRQDWLRRT